MSPEDRSAGVRQSHLRRTRSIIGTAIVVGLWLIAAPLVEWTAGSQFRSVWPMLALLLGALLVLGWGPDVGFRRSAVLLLLVPLYGFYIFLVLVYRLFHLPERYWEGSWIPPKWHWGYVIVVAVGAVFFAFPLAQSENWPDFQLDRSLEESVDWEMRRRYSTDEEMLVLVMRHRGSGFVVKESGSPSSLTIGWWRPVKRWYGTKWEPFDATEGRYSYNTSFDRVNCQGTGEFSYCYARLPAAATYFDLVAAGRTFAGSASNGFGVVFASIPGDITSWRAFDRNGVLIAGSFIDLRPRPTEEGPFGTAQKKVGTARPMIKPSPAPEQPVTSPSR